MDRTLISRSAIILCLFVMAVPLTSIAAQTLPAGITLEQFNKLTPDQQAALLQRLQRLQTSAQLIGENQALMQLPESLIPLPDTTLGITAVDTTQFYVENIFDFGLVAGEFDSTHTLELFGRRSFQLGPEAFAPAAFGPVGENYRLGPGDEVIIQMWGTHQALYTQVINREGYLLIPEVGQIQVAYITLKEVKRRLLNSMTPSYEALNYGRNDATAFLDVSLGKLRSIQVFVLGDAVIPGPYTLSSVSTIFTALHAAGGPSNIGSLRNIQLSRGDQAITSLDGYDYLLRGDASKDVRLEDGDIVFIPPIGPKVMVQGRVRRPAVYEIKPGNTIKDIIEFCGGLSASARLDKAQIARILPPSERGQQSWVRAFIDVNLDRVLSSDSPQLTLLDGDVLSVFSVPDDQRDFVVVEGSVWNEGRIQWKDGLTLRDAIQQSGNLREEALMSRVEVIRTNPDETTTQISRSLDGVMNGDPDENIKLERRDRIIVSSIHDVFPRNYVTIYGPVETPGEYLLHEDMTVMDMIVRAGGLSKDAWMVSAEVVRMRLAEDGSVTEFQRYTVPIDISYAPRGSRSFILEDFDQVFIRRKPKWEETRNVILGGEVLFPGDYALVREGETVSDLIERAGGLTPQAFAEGARFFREFEEAGRINLNLEEALSRSNSIDNIVMQPGDSLYVPPRVEFVTIRGRVGYPSSVLYVRGKKPKYYIAQAGGYAERADKRRTRVILPNGSTWQPRWFILPDPEVQPGSEIYVPVREEIDRTTWEVLRDTTALLSSFTTVLLLIWQIGR